MTNKNVEYKCDQCDYVTDRKFNLTRHTEKHNAKPAKEPKIKPVKEPKSYKCENCEYSSTDKSNYNRHIKVHEETVVKQYKCDACDKLLRDEAHMNQHYKSKNHLENVRKNFPSAVDQTKCPAFKLVKAGRVEKYVAKYPLIKEKRAEYIKKVDAEVPRQNYKPIEKRVIKTEQIMLDPSEYVNELEEDDKVKLIEHFVKWLKLNKLDPEDENITDDYTIDEQYDTIIDILSDDGVVAYFKKYNDVDVINVVEN